MPDNIFRAEIGQNPNVERILNLFTEIAEDRKMEVYQVSPTTVTAEKGSKFWNFLLGCIAPHYYCEMSVYPKQGYLILEYDKMDLCTGGGLLGVSSRHSFFKTLFRKFTQEI